MPARKKAKPQTTLPPVDPTTTAAPETDETSVDSQKTVESPSPFPIVGIKGPMICMLYSTRNFISRHKAYDIACKTIIHLVWCLIVIIPFSSFADVSKIPLTPEEISWLNAKHIVRIRIGDSPPFMFTDGEVRGIAIDYLTQIFNRHGIQFSYVTKPGVTWPQALKYIEQHDVVDMVPTAKITDERKKHMLFTNEYISAPWVIFTRSDSDFTSSIEDLKGKTVSVEQGYIIQQKLQNEYPGIKLKVVSAQLDSYATIPIRDLSTGLVDAYIGNLLSTTYLIQSMGYTNVKVAAPTPFDNHNQAMAIRDDWPELISIINKTLAVMTPEEQSAIRNRWLTVRYDYGISYTDVLIWILSVLAVASLVVGFVFFWNRQLKKEVTLRKKIEGDLLKSENRLRSTLEATPFPIAVVDRQDDQIIYWSNRAYELFGHTAPTASEWYQLAYPDPQYRQEVIERWQEQLNKARKSGHPINTGEYKITGKDGSVRICELYATFLPDNLIVTFCDITERKQAEEDLRNSEKKFRALFEQSGGYCMILDPNTSDGIPVIIDANEAALLIHGYKRDAFIGQPVSDIDDEDGKRLVKKRTAEIMTGKPFYVENDHVRKDGTTFSVAVNAKRIDIGDEPPFILTTEFDITAKKQVEKEKVKLENRLQQAQKMEAIGTLAGGIAHDFNNILAVIIGFTEIAKDDSQPGSTIYKALDKVLEAGDRAKSLVNQILDFSRQTDTECFPLHPAVIVRKAIKMLRPSLPTTIEINKNIDTQTGLILANPTQIHQILMNLCTNAFHAMEDTGGKLDISLKETHLSSNDLVNEPTIETGTFIQLSVCDTGPGIAPEVEKKIFDPYFTTKETGKGTGMGLSIVHGIVNSYGGFISFDSKLGKGTSFNVFLPVVENAVLSETEDIEKIPIGSEKILFIDDEEIIAKMGKTMLEKLGYHVTVRKSSFEALEIFRNQPDLFDLVITDQTMPGMTGSDLSRRMLQIRPDIPIILCTGYSTIMSEGKAKSIGIKEFALKPLAMKDIAKLIRKVLVNNQA